MKLTEQQETAMKIVIDKYYENAPCVCIAGYAGTGKSTTVAALVENLGLYGDEVAYVSYTGKAADILTHKNGYQAYTAHQLLYYTHKRNGVFVYTKKAHLDKSYKLIVVDEISMLPMDMWKQLLSYHIPIIALGDPFQLPPIDPTKDNHVLDKPDIMLTDVVRQAQDSGIVQIGMKLRAGDDLYYGTYGADGCKDAIILHKEDLEDRFFNNADQILCGTNRKRHELNAYMRQLKGLSGNPQIGDKLISLDNHWNIMDSTGNNALINGTIGYVSAIKDENMRFDIKKENFPRSGIPIFRTKFTSYMNDNFDDLPIDKTFITTGAKFLTEKQEDALNASKIYRDDVKPLYFDYGYAITTHKAQGSEWPRVLAFDEHIQSDNLEYRRFLYTAVTRAKSKLVLVI